MRQVNHGGKFVNVDLHPRIKLRTGYRQTFTPHERSMEIADGKRRTVGGKQEIGTLEIGRLWRNKVKLDRPLAECALNRCARYGGNRRFRFTLGIEIYYPAARASAGMRRMVVPCMGRPGFRFTDGFTLKRIGNSLLFEVFKCLLKKVALAVIHKVTQMSRNDIGSTFYNALMHDALFIIRFGFTGYNVHGPSGTMADTGAKSIAKQVADETGFAVDHLQRSLGATRNAVSASGTSCFIYGDNLSFHFLLLLYVQHRLLNVSRSGFHLICRLKVTHQLADGHLFKLALDNLLNTHDLMTQHTARTIAANLLAEHALRHLHLALKNFNQLRYADGIRILFHHKAPLNTLF